MSGPAGKGVLTGTSGLLPECKQDVAIALDRHMMNTHLELDQLWRRPVEWCAVWKGSVRDCLDHLWEKHGGSQFAALKNLGKFFPPWTVPCVFWHAALRLGVSGVAVDANLIHDLGRRLVHKYQIYRDPIPHPVLREGVVRKLIDFVCRTMAMRS